MKIVYEIDQTAASPNRAHNNDSGWDIYSPYSFSLKKNELITIMTGIKFKLQTPLILRMLRFLGVPLTVEAQIRPKSSKSSSGIEVSIGTIDHDYRGSVGVTLYNRTNKVIKFAKGEKIAQIVFSLVLSGKSFQLVEGPVETNTSRGTGGFGSTGHLIKN